MKHNDKKNLCLVLSLETARFMLMPIHHRYRFVKRYIKEHNQKSKSR